MIVDEAEVMDLKTWIVKKLEDISDADSDVLADYVLALIRADDPEPQLRENAIENLDDFLRESTVRFVDDILEVIKSKAFVPGYVPPPAASTSPILSISTGAASAFSTMGPRHGPSNGNAGSRKRSYNDGYNAQSDYDPHYGQSDRQMKQVRRGGMGNGHRGGFPRNGREFNGHQGPNNMNLPGQSPNVPFDPNDAMAAVMAIQAMGMPMPGMPAANSPPNEKRGSRGSNFPPLPGVGKNRIDARCRDYDTKGFCLRGIACPFNHGDNSVVVPGQSQEYDPKTPTIEGFSANGHSPIAELRGRGRGRARGGSDRGTHSGRGRNRADFSMAGANNDASITTIVVEQIPEEYFEEEQVRNFFSTFGKVEEVTMKPYKRLALIRYDSFHAAKAAWESPKVIFDNRFVKVYWYNASMDQPRKSGTQSAGSPTTASKPEEPSYDKEKFQRDSEAAQKKLQERKALQQETEAKRLELEKMQGELAKKREEEIQKMKEKLAAKGRSLPEDMDLSQAENVETNKPKRSANTEKLLAQLKALEDEAKSLGLDPEPWNSERGRGRGRGRGSYRGWDGFSGRGGYESTRGGFRGRGRGTFRGAVRAGGAFNLDNRPRSVKVSGVYFDDAKDESFKQFLFTVGEFTSVEPDEAKTSQIIAFKDRATAEEFYYGPHEIPGVGKLEFSWIGTPLPPVSKSVTATDGDTEMGGVPSDDTPIDLNGNDREQDRDEDYDVAEDHEWIT